MHTRLLRAASEADVRSCRIRINYVMICAPLSNYKDPAVYRTRVCEFTSFDFVIRDEASGPLE